jgi:hypothetical protein
LSIEGKTRKLDYLTRLYIPDESYQEFPTDSNGFVLDKIKACEIKPPEGGLFIYGLHRATVLILAPERACPSLRALSSRNLGCATPRHIEKPCACVFDVVECLLKALSVSVVGVGYGCTLVLGGKTH